MTSLQPQNVSSLGLRAPLVAFAGPKLPLVVTVANKVAIVRQNYGHGFRRVVRLGGNGIVVDAVQRSALTIANVDEVGVAALPHLAVVGLGGELVGAFDQRAVGVRVIRPDPTHELLRSKHGFA